MKLPRQIKHFNVFVDGTTYAGQVKEVTLPKFTRKMEEYRGGGMIGPVKIDLGLELLSMEIVMGGFVADLVKKFGVCEVDGVQLRFAGSLQSSDSCAAKALEITVAGRWEEIELPAGKAGEEGDTKFTAPLTYIRIEYEGKEICEIDVLGMIERWDGVDRLEKHRKNIGV